MDRRTFLLMAGACAATPARAQAALRIIPLWPAAAPGAGGPAGPPRTSARGALSNIAMPFLEIHTPARPGGACVLIAAGGGYRQIQMEKEARPAARWLAARGITAFILVYRLPGEGWENGPLAPLQDAQRALRLVRQQAVRRGRDARRIGVLGFSAGGHLMGLAATRSALRTYQPVDDADALPACPEAAALVYPVITLEPPYDHTSTRRMLIGDHPSAAQSAEWSVEPHVGAHCPPVFLVQARDDRTSNPQNSLIMAEACQRAGVPVELHEPTTGGHGFGMGRPGSGCAEWPRWYEGWLRAQDLLA
ncbi:MULTISPECIES: alpha/beta hydrolase [unclassified Xanthobacter]|uniref:alpha/beta hydrolase n=1 Tax=unclassified Xanthobacter TaxID=2623496 RepID=UPI001F29ED9A|nr:MULTISPECIES: alpha/beta hydrolase [unclassified Xanthobacter]